MEDRTKEIMAQTAYKCASWIHAAEVTGGANPDTEYLFDMARKIANGMFKLAGSPSAGQAGGPTPQQGPRTEGARSPSSPSVPSCPRCNEPMEYNPKWTGYDKKPKWRCSQRGRFVPDKGWSGCDGAKWEDAA